MERLNLPTYSFNIKSLEQRKHIFDSIRRKFVVLTPEEWVRQNFIQYLIHEKGYKPSLLSIEHSFKLNQLSRRSDIVAYDNKAKARLMVECKAPSVKISQSTFDQIARYNMEMKVEYLIVTNGLQHYACQMDHIDNRIQYLKDIPLYEDVIS